VIAWAAAALVAILAVATVVVSIRDDAMAGTLLIPIQLGWAWMGCLLLARRPGHLMGPLLYLRGLVYAVTAMPSYSPGTLPFATAMSWVGNWAWAPSDGLFLVVLLVFPDGRLLSRRWGPALWAALAFSLLAAAGYSYALFPESRGVLFGSLPNMFAVPRLTPVLAAVLSLALACWLGAAAAVVASMWLRWRRADLAGRQQLKWFFAAAPVMEAGWLIDIFVLNPAASQSILAVLVLRTLPGVLLPVAIGVAVLRYRLYEIDVLLSRAARYGSLTAIVAAVYLAEVAVARWVFGIDRDLGVQVAATVMAAVALLPLRGRVQRLVDRLFYGDRGAPYDALARRGRRVEEAAGPGSVLDSVVKTIADSLRLPYVAVELRVGDGWTPASAYGDRLTDVAEFALVTQRETVGRLLVGRRAPGEALSPDDERLLADLARQAGPAAHAVALRQALDASRADLVTTREEERRRLRRDLHDGLSPVLGGLTLGLDAARAKAPGQADLQELLGKLKAETQRAAADVRRIVYGLRPPALDELGLARSLDEEIRRLQYHAPELAVTLDNAAGDGLADLPAAVEVACYRIVAEALANIARHARATGCRVRIEVGLVLEVEVCDDGVGLPDGWRAGVGITSMRERVAELGGDLTIEPHLPRGTRITARLPLRGQL
jgi:signal transduction histidine kinase